MAYKRRIPSSESEGGTGTNSLTPYAPISSASDVIVSVDTGFSGSGNVLTSKGSSLPEWQPLSLPTCYFLITRAAAQNNVTGNNTTATIQYDTIIVQEGGNFFPSNNYTFVVPYSGYYIFTIDFRCSDTNLAGANQEFHLWLSTPNFFLMNGSAAADGSTLYAATFTNIIRLTAGETVSSFFRADGLAGNTIDLPAGTNYLSGFFLGGI